MKNRIIIDLADHMADIMSSQPHTLSSKFKDENEEEQIINILDNEMFKSYFEYFFYSYSMISFRELTDSDVVFRFNNMWRIFQMEEKENLEKIVQGYYWDYVPVYNYDRTEKWTDVRTGSEDDERTLLYGQKKTENRTTGSYKDEMTPTGSKINTKTTTGGYTDTNTEDEDSEVHQVSTMDSPEWRNKEKVIYDENVDSMTRQYDDLEDQTIDTFDDYKETTERTYNNFQNDVTDLTHTDTDDNTHTYNEVTDTHEGRMFGNIGVLTNTQMIEGEFELRIHELGYEWLKRFFDKYFVML